ncbi:MAG: outer membrane protein transport protein [Melioribacteraceae bacterium]|nr:outer membrane protein transport protein [Melioribacteraceae bacterium]
MNKKLLFLIISLIVTTQVFASGFQINDQGARGMAMASAGAALAFDASTLFYNPAGLSQLSGTQIMFGTTLVKPSSSFRGVSPEIDEVSKEPALFTPINLYVSHQLNDDWAIGFGVNNQFGLGSEWDENWIGRYLTIKTQLTTFYLTGGASYKFSDKLSVGLSASYVIGSVEILRKSRLDPFDADATIDLSGTGNSFAYALGLLYKPSDLISIGLNFRSTTKIEFSGSADITAPSALKSLLPSGNITAPITLPLNATIGLALTPSDEWTITSAFQYVGWSSYDKMEVTFTDSDPDYVSTSLRNSEDSWIARLGAEYSMSSDLDLRGGLFYDKNPAQDEWLEPSLGDADRSGITLGVGYKVSSNITIDLAYMFVRFVERTITNSKVDYTSGVAGFNGTYNSTANLLGINFTYLIN